MPKTQENLMTERFLHRACLYLREEFPEQVESLSDEALVKEILEGYAKASSYGFETEQGVMGFIDLLYRISKTFDTDEETEWAQPVLEDEDETEENKIDALRQAYLLYTAISANEEE